MSEPILDWDDCVECGKRIVTKIDGTLRVHGPRHEPCEGSGCYGEQWWVARDTFMQRQAAAGPCVDDKERQPMPLWLKHEIAGSGFVPYEHPSEEQP